MAAREAGYVPLKWLSGICVVKLMVFLLAASGGRYRDKIRLYADTPGVEDPAGFAETMKKRVEDQGFTWLKMDLGIHWCEKSRHYRKQ